MLTRVLPPHGPGGMAAAAWDLACALQDAGADVQVLTTAGCAPNGDGPVRVRAVDAPPGRYSGAWWRGSRIAYQRLEGGAPNVVLGVSAAAYGLAAHRRPGGPVLVFQAHGTSVGEIASRLRTRRPAAVLGAGRNLAWGVGCDWMYRRYDAVVAVGEAVRRDLVQWPTRALVGDTPVELIRNGVRETALHFSRTAREALRNRLGLPSEAVLALFAARLQPDKGAGAAVEAVGRAAATGAPVHLAVLGDGPDGASLKRLAATGVAAPVHFEGAVRREAMATWLSAADVLLFPTERSEGLPLVVLEALAAGLPVLTTPHGAGDPELDVVRLPPRDVAGFADALRQVQPARDTRASRLPPAFRLETSAARYLDLFDRLLCGRGVARAA